MSECVAVNEWVKVIDSEQQWVILSEWARDSEWQWVKESDSKWQWVSEGVKVSDCDRQWVAMGDREWMSDTKWVSDSEWVTVSEIERQWVTVSGRGLCKNDTVHSIWVFHLCFPDYLSSAPSSKQGPRRNHSKPRYYHDISVHTLWQSVLVNSALYNQLANFFIPSVFTHFEIIANPLHNI